MRDIHFTKQYRTRGHEKRGIEGYFADNIFRWVRWSGYFHVNGRTWTMNMEMNRHDGQPPYFLTLARGDHSVVKIPKRFKQRWQAVRFSITHMTELSALTRLGADEKALAAWLT